jgi:hypothetical protein
VPLSALEPVVMGTLRQANQSQAFAYIESSIDCNYAVCRVFVCLDTARKDFGHGSTSWTWRRRVRRRCDYRKPESGVAHSVKSLRPVNHLTHQFLRQASLYCTLLDLVRACATVGGALCAEQTWCEYASIDLENNALRFQTWDQLSGRHRV